MHLDRFGLAGGMCVDHRQLFAEPQTRTHQRLQLSAGLEDIEPADGAQHVLAHLTLLPKALHDLKIGVGAGAFDAEIHRRFLFLY